MDIVFTDSCVGGCQVQQVVIPGFSTLQLVFRVFGLSLKKQNGALEPIQDVPVTVPLACRAPQCPRAKV